MNLEKFLEKLNSLPDFSSTTDLIDSGVFTTKETLSRLRREGKGPPFVVINASSIRYPRQELIEWVKSHTPFLSQDKPIGQKGGDCDDI
jgi:hypothetical protein